MPARDYSHIRKLQRVEETPHVTFDGRSALHKAAEYDHLEYAEAIVNNIRNRSASDNLGETSKSGERVPFFQEKNYVPTQSKV